MDCCFVFQELFLRHEQSEERLRCGEAVQGLQRLGRYSDIWYEYDTVDDKILHHPEWFNCLIISRDFVSDSTIQGGKSDFVSQAV